MSELRELTDAEREAAVARLNAAVETGHLTLDEFGDQVATVYQARTAGELAAVLESVPSPQPAAAPDRGLVHRTLVGTVKRGGRWRLPGYTGFRTLVGTVKLDLREAQVSGPDAAIAVSVSVGTIKVWLPASWRVEVYGESVVGGRLVEENQPPSDQSAPTLRLRLDTALGTVKVYRC